MKRFLVLILFLVFISGCLGGREVKIEANNGLKITEFSADPLTAEFNDPVFFNVDIENVGGTTADNVELTLYGIKNVWRSSSSESSVVSSNPEYSPGSMSPPDIVLNRPGDFEIWAGQYYPPILPEGVSSYFPVTARVTYDYHTTGTISIPAYSKSYYRINKGDVESAARVDNTNAPIQIALTKGTTPIVVDENLKGNEDATFIIEFRNVGDGWPISDGQIGGFFSGESKITLHGNAEFKNCLGETGGNEASLSGVDFARLRSDGRMPIGCSISIPRNDWGIVSTGDIIFTIDMRYRYYIEDTVSIKVIGTNLAEPVAPSRGEGEEEDEDKPTIELAIDGTAYDDLDEESLWQNNDFEFEVRFTDDVGLYECRYSTSPDTTTLKTISECEDETEYIFEGTAEVSSEIPQGKNSYIITLNAKDIDGGDERSVTKLFKFHIDYTAPSVGAIKETTATAGVASTYTATVSESLSHSRLKKCELYVDGDVYDGTVEIDDCEDKASCTVQIGGVTLTEGEHILRMKCFDHAGNEGLGNSKTITVSP